MVQYLFYYTIWYLLCNCNRSNIVWWPGQKWLCGKLSTVGQSYKKKHEHILHQLRMDWLFKGHFCSDLPIWARLAKQSLRAHSSWWSNRQKCSSSLFCHHHRSWECYCFVARGHYYCCLFYCALKGLQAIHVRPYESCHIKQMIKQIANV